MKTLAPFGSILVLFVSGWHAANGEVTQAVLCFAIFILLVLLITDKEE